jgi:uncharacterized protein (DUF1697 family)
MGKYVALLRGINVGGTNLIKMAALKACFEKHGMTGVTTLIQSGNVVFESAVAETKLVEQIERMLTATFKYPAGIVLRSQKQLRAIIAGAPRGFGAEPTKRRYDVLYLKEPLKAAVALPQVPTREGVDEAHAGPGVLYFSRLSSRASQSRLSRIASLPIYKQLTIRNWNTSTKLLRIMEELDEADPLPAPAVRASRARRQV